MSQKIITENRSTLADVLKGLAVVAMMQVHVLELFTTTSFQESRFASLMFFLGAAPVAPVFMIILGYFLAASEKSLVQNLLRGLKAFVLGLLLNVGLNFNLIIKITKGEINLNVWQYLFGVDILLFAGLAIIFIALFKKILEKNPILPLLLIFAIPISAELLAENYPQSGTINYFSSFIYGSGDWSYFPLLPWLAYPLTGFVFFQFSKAFKTLSIESFYMKTLILAGYAAFLYFTYSYASGISKNLMAYYHHGILFFVWTLVFIGPYVMVTKTLNDLIGSTWLIRYVKFLGKNVTLVYVLQWLIIGNTATEIYRTLSKPLDIALAFLCVVILTSLLAYAGIILKKLFWK